MKCSEKVCLELIEEIERAKLIQTEANRVATEEFQLKDVWPQLRSALSWLLKNQLEGATELMRMVICKRRKEKELEKSKVEHQMKSLLDQVKGLKQF